MIIDIVSPENYRLQSAYEKNLIIKMVLVSGFSFHIIYSTCVVFSRE